MSKSDVMASKFDLKITLPGASEPLQVQVEMPTRNVVIFVDELSTGTKDIRKWGELLNELVLRMNLDPEQVVWMRRREHHMGGYALSRIIADLYEGRYYDIRFASLPLQVDKQFRKVLDNPRWRSIVEEPGSGVFSRFPKPRLLNNERLSLMLATVMGLFIILALITLSMFRSSQQGDYAYWENKLATVNADNAAVLAAANSRADQAQASAAKLQRQNLIMENQMEQLQSDLAASKATVLPPPTPPVTNAAPATNQAPQTADHPQVLPALPPDTTSGRDVDLEK